MNAMLTYQPNEDFARHLDAVDPLRQCRDLFLLPPGKDGKPLIYFCGHSLGLEPRGVRPIVEQELDDWARLGVEGHLRGPSPWYSYHEQFRESGARLVGAHPGEVVMMNSLTVNLHLMMATFYRPTPDRCKILMDGPPFPSDLYALESQIRHHGFDPAQALIIARPRPGENLIPMEDVEQIFDHQGPEIALVLWNPVNFFTGQFFDVKSLTALARRHGCVVGLDLAHAAGNVILHLHDWQVDFAVWCSYKYLNSGPGAVAGCFVHDKNGQNVALPRFAGWWGTDPDTRFHMEDGAFHPQRGAAGWQVSNPPIFSLAPLRASLAIFDEIGMPALRAKSELLTAYLQYLLDLQGRFDILTPRVAEQRGCQLSLRVGEQPQKLLGALHEAGVVCDFRAPDVLRVAPVPLYNTFHEVWTFARILPECT